MRTTRSAIVIAALVATAALVGCAARTSQVAVPTPSPTDCGTARLGPGDPGLPKDALDCFTAGAASGATTTLVVQAPTTEGDPITTTYRASGTDEVEVVVDSTQDRFAGTGAGITTQTCRYTVTEVQIDVRACTDPTPVAP
jgi:hypothetical protein